MKPGAKGHLRATFLSLGVNLCAVGNDITHLAFDMGKGMSPC